MKKSILLCLAFLVSLVFAETPAEQLERVNSNLDSLGEYASSSVIGKDDAPVAVSGDITMRLKHFDFFKASALQYHDKMRTSVMSALNAAIVVSPASYLTVFSNLYLPFDFSGYFANDLATTPNTNGYDNGERVPYFHSTDYYGVAISENMLIGLEMRGGYFGAKLSMGGVIWTNQSPLSMWERETMARFASQYETFEEEKVVSMYYKEKNFKPVKEGGRAFWTNRSFGGFLFELDPLPFNLKGQFLVSQPNDVDIGMRDGLRLYGSLPGELEMNGTYDMRGDVYAGRFAKERITFADADIAIGLNYMGINYHPGLIYEKGVFNGYMVLPDSSIRFANNRVATVDIKGNLTPKFYMALDLAMSWDDSLVFQKFPKCTGGLCYDKSEYSDETSSPVFGVYAKLQDKHWEPITLELIYLPKDFYSPYSMSNPSRYPSWGKDEFYVGAGTFRYGPNMMGANLKVEPEFNRGRFDVQYGIHKQVEKGADIVHFKYNLNGRAMWESSNSWTKHKPFFLADSGVYNEKKFQEGARYIAREGGKHSSSKLLDQAGGVRGGTWELWESFTPYQNAMDAERGNMPMSEKWNSSVVLDMGYDIGHWFNTDRNIMLSLYTALSGVSTSFAPIAYSESQSDMLMWNWFVQSEPAIAITPTLHGLLILGFEMFRAENAYAVIPQGTISMGANSAASGYTALHSLYDDGGFMKEFVFAPINILQTALGFGLDWDFAARAGLHFRYKYITHKDEAISKNDWKAHYVQAETKVWF
jgi:hypothetical protein